MACAVNQCNRCGDDPCAPSTQKLHINRRHLNKVLHVPFSTRAFSGLSHFRRNTGIVRISILSLKFQVSLYLYLFDILSNSKILLFAKTSSLILLLIAIVFGSFHYRSMCSGKRKMRSKAVVR